MAADTTYPGICWKTSQILLELQWPIWLMPLYPDEETEVKSPRNLAQRPLNVQSQTQTLSRGPFPTGRPAANHVNDSCHVALAWPLPEGTASPRLHTCSRLSLSAQNRHLRDEASLVRMCDAKAERASSVWHLSACCGPPANTSALPVLGPTRTPRGRRRAPQANIRQMTPSFLVPNRKGTLLPQTLQSLLPSRF